MNAEESETETLSALPKECGKYLRYHYTTFECSLGKDPGHYIFECKGVRTAPPWRSAHDVDANIW